MGPAFISKSEEQLWPNGYRRDVWMVVDSARDQQIFARLLESRLERACLYSGVIPPALETVAPYLLQLEFEDRRCRRFLQQAWGNSWGIFLKCDTTLDRLKKHLRGFLSVRDPGGNKLLFRYYDPRVLRTYLPSCSSEDLRIMFGPISLFTTEGHSLETMIKFGFDGSKLIQQEHAVEGSGTRPMPAMAASLTGLLPQRPGMLSIRREQLAAFSRAEVEKFEDWMVAHLRKFFANQCNKLGEGKLRDIIQHGIKRAADHELIAKRDVCKYIDVMMVLGKDFDKDKRYPWVTQTLGRHIDPGVKMQSVLMAARLSLGKR